MVSVKCYIAQLLLPYVITFYVVFIALLAFIVVFIAMLCYKRGNLPLTL